MLCLLFVSCSFACSSDHVSVETDVDETETSSASDYSPDFTFNTTDRDGNAYDESIFAGYELTMVNFFEPWCGPCVSEMDDIEQLYEDYSSEGFMVIGVYSDTSMESELDAIISSTGVSYPVLHLDRDLARFQTGYYPTTFFVDGEGHIVTMDGTTDFLYIGAGNYDYWESVVTGYLRSR